MQIQIVHQQETKIINSSNNGKCEENLVKVFVFTELLDVAIAMENIDFCKLTVVKSQQNLNALGQLDGVVAIATDRHGYSDGQAWIQRRLVPVASDFTPKSKKRGKPSWKNPCFCTSDHISSLIQFPCLNFISCRCI